MIATKTVVEQLVDIYFDKEWWHNSRMSEESAYKYHLKLLNDGNIICYVQEGEVLGYVEFWRINYEQWGRLVCHESFSSYQEDVLSGNIAYVANTWIREDKRNSEVTKWLKLIFFKNNFHCDYFVGEALRKKTQPIKVFKRTMLKSRLFKEGEIKDGIN